MKKEGRKKIDERNKRKKKGGRTKKAEERGEEIRKTKEGRK